MNTYILYVYKFAIAVAVFLAIVMIIWGGFLYITSETPFKIADGRSKIQGAVIGLIMVLGSYLILFTIDPRLVNIDSQIPVIDLKIDQLKSAQEKFLQQVTSDLSNLSAENNLEVQKLNSAKSEAQKRLDGVSKQFANGLIDEETATLEKSKILEEIRIIETKKSVFLAENIGAVKYASALNDIYSPNATAANIKQYTSAKVPNPIGGGLRPVNTPGNIVVPNEIQNQYNMKINKLLANPNSSAEDIQRLDKQMDFYIAQVNEDVKLSEKIKDEITTEKFYTESLNKKLVDYETNMKLTSEQKTLSSGLTPEQYDKIMQTRINMIEQTLSEPRVVPAKGGINTLIN